LAFDLTSFRRLGIVWAREGIVSLGADIVLE
jgi:hypothetical protein